jgi:hypothetical protein
MYLMRLSLLALEHHGCEPPVIEMRGPYRTLVVTCSGIVARCNGLEIGGVQ